MRATFSRSLERIRTLPSMISRWPKWARWTLLGVLVIAIGASGFAFYKVRQAQASTAQQPDLQTAVARQGDLILRASGVGTLIAADEVNLVFKTSGILTKLNVKLGDQVKAGDLLAQLDDTAQQTKLVQAKQTLLELTSPAAIATAQQNYAQAEQDLINAQVTVNNLTFHNQSAIDVSYAAYVLTLDRLSRAEENFNNVKGLSPDDPSYAAAYQDLYSARQASNSALYVYNAYSGKPSQAKVDAANAELALAKARLTEYKNLIAALTGGEVPVDATGSGYVQLQQAKINVQDAQDNLDATRLVAPISGTVMAANGKVGETVGSGTFITIADLSQAEIQIYMDESDWSNIKVGYEAQVTFDALPDQTFTGKVIQVAPSLLSSQGSSVVQGLIRLNQTQDSATANPFNELPLGVSASVDVISAQARNAVLVPIQALHELSPGSYAVFIMLNGTPTLKVVEVGLQSDTFAEIKSGVKVGDVVTTGIQATTK